MYICTNVNMRAKGDPILGPEQAARIAKALADPTRMSILAVIAQAGELSCGATAEKFPVGQPTVSHHLKVLADAGLVSVRRMGQHALFQFEGHVLVAYSKWLESTLLKASHKKTDKGGSQHGK
jgi:ArsR family transcriptional regulator